MADDPRAVHGRRPVDARWHPQRDLNNDAAALLRKGETSAAGRMLRATPTAIAGADDPSARDLRARALLNLASVHEFDGDLGEALRLTDEALAAASDLLERTGDAYGTRTVLVNGILSRAQTLALMDRADEALTAIDDVETALAAHEVDQAGLLRFSAHNTRTGLLIVQGRLREAEAEAQRSLAAATAVDPRLSAHVYLNLGAIAQRTGDEDAAREFVRLASLLQEEDADAVSAQIAAENSARIAMQQGRHEEARIGFLRAVELAKAAGLRTRLAASRTGLAAVYLQSGNPVLAVRRLRELIGEMDETADVHERREAWAFLGDAESKRGRFAAADEAYRTARELSRSPHERCRVDLRRAEMQAEWASVTPMPGRRMERLRAGLDLAIPVLLATEALRGGFAPGAVRERWSRQVAAPARELAFRLAVTLGEAEILFALIEDATASATLQAEAIEARDAERQGAAGPEPVPLLPALAAAGEELPAAASGFLSGQDAPLDVRFAAPPRVVAIPGREPVLAEFIRSAESAYGVRVRSEQVVAAW
ncbi:tetratricopeptide repeat protein [Microbacterium tumbae]